MTDVKAPLGHRTVITRRDQQVAAALSAVRAGQAEVGDPAEPHVVDDAQAVRGGLQHQRTVGQVEEGDVVDRVGVSGQEQRPGVHQLREKHHVAVPDPCAQEPLPKGVGRHPLNRVHERLDTVQVVQMVAQLRRGLTRRVPVGELQGPDPSLHSRRSRDRGGHGRPGHIIGGHNGLLQISRCGDHRSNAPGTGHHADRVKRHVSCTRPGQRLRDWSRSSSRQSTKGFTHSG